MFLGIGRGYIRTQWHVTTACGIHKVLAWIPPNVTGDQIQRTVEQGAKENIPRVWYPRVVDGLGQETRYQDRDAITIDQGDYRYIDAIHQPKMTSGVSGLQLQTQLKQQETRTGKAWQSILAGKEEYVRGADEFIA
jgi:hypothetical protein